MKAAQTKTDNHEPEVLDAATLAAMDKGVKSLEDGKYLPVEDARRVIRDRFKTYLKANLDFGSGGITRDLV